jgi:hypothetical protein
MHRWPFFVQFLSAAGTKYGKLGDSLLLGLVAEPEN